MHGLALCGEEEEIPLVPAKRKPVIASHGPCERGLSVTIFGTFPPSARRAP